MSKKITFGTIDPLIKETEIKSFIREFESKRADRDIFALHQQTLNANTTVANAKQSTDASQQHLEKINKRLRDLNDRIQNQILKEDVYQSHRDSDTLVRMEKHGQEKTVIDESIQSSKLAIESNFQEQSHQLCEKYQIIL
ncbi:hypothetical protein DFA_00343 [Cavenderia fasciculata]|uniref:Biogenesis of lysosome-related organelles complex 1 subunit 5 n=1 Tax=Cavenderia fasciculata TaxID=261658 RepID=F4PRD0_CACFS|nr:uncharacterized protein DFA_00343 [Cavenderia fasciculata]EGG20482.1 hypothetical protein DFA_00343 [Cavenderia fasciculata]|eukprot:XP_004358332.1 hypothetical protein DFA_00343 [Cavenderia fasciculata]